MSLDLEAREASWLHCRRFADRRRLLHPQTRARALLAHADTLIRRARDGYVPELPSGFGSVRERLGAELLGETDDPLPEQLTIAWRSRFLAAVAEVEAIGWGRGAYDFDNGVAYPIRRVENLADPRLVAIAKAAVLAGVSEAELDRAAWKMARLERAALVIGEQFMERLPASPPPTSRPSFTRRPHKPAKPKPKRASYNDAKLCEILANMPDDPRLSDQLEMCAELLGETYEGPRLVGEGPDAPEPKPEAMLVAAAERCDYLVRTLELAVVEKARLLSTAFPRSTGCEPKYLNRAADIDAETVRPVREALADAREQMINAATRARFVSRWPGDRDQPRHTRARMLADQLREDVTSEEIEQARSLLGYPQTQVPV